MMKYLPEEFKAIRLQTKEKKKANYANSIQKLIDYDIRFEEGEKGFVRVYSNTGVNYHFWPTTGYWCVGKGFPSYSQKGRGIFNLLQIIQGGTDHGNN